MGCDSYIYTEIKGKDSDAWVFVHSRLYIPRYISNEFYDNHTVFKQLITFTEFTELNPSKEVYDYVNNNHEGGLPYFVQITPSLRMFMVTGC